MKWLDKRFVTSDLPNFKMWKLENRNCQQGRILKYALNIIVTLRTTFLYQERSKGRACIKVATSIEMIFSFKEKTIILPTIHMIERSPL